MSIKFTKWHGLGNDFIIVNAIEEKLSDYKNTAIRVCNRHFGIGADGLVLILPSNNADFEMRIFNSDGSEAEMCGNVTRCVARYAYQYGLTDKHQMTLETKAGYIKPELIFDSGNLKTVRVDMGMPIIKPADIPVNINNIDKVVDYPLTIGNATYNITCVSMGNPHCIIFADDIATIDLAAVGPLIEKHSAFPNKINVEFVQVLSKTSLRMRVWERGAGITLACGTGASATLVAAVLNNKAERNATVSLDGGDLYVEWGNDNHIYMSGPAVEICSGTYLDI